MDEHGAHAIAESDEAPRGFSASTLEMAVEEHEIIATEADREKRPLWTPLR